MRPLAILLTALVVALSPAAVLAKSGTTPPGQATKSDKAEPPGQAKSEDKPEPPRGPNPPGPDGAGPPGPDGNGPPGQSNSAEQDDAQRAVENREALPLARIVAVAEGRSTGHVINARLVRVDGVLLYQLTLLDESGRSWREYYYARTGNPVIIR
jgi:hypothetical protein